MSTIDDLRPSPAKHRGCAVCRSVDEPILTSGTVLPSSPLRGSDSAAVCSSPDCRQHVRILGDDHA